MQALNTGSLAWATANCVAYYYMVRPVGFKFTVWSRQNACQLACHSKAQHEMAP